MTEYKYVVNGSFSSASKALAVTGTFVDGVSTFALGNNETTFAAVSGKLSDYLNYKHANGHIFTQKDRVAGAVDISYGDNVATPLFSMKNHSYTLSDGDYSASGGNLSKLFSDYLTNEKGYTGEYNCRFVNVPVTTFAFVPRMYASGVTSSAPITNTVKPVTNVQPKVEEPVDIEPMGNLFGDTNDGDY
jgi:hypothetical protein